MFEIRQSSQNEVRSESKTRGCDQQWHPIVNNYKQQHLEEKEGRFKNKVGQWHLSPNFL